MNKVLAAVTLKSLKRAVSYASALLLLCAVPTGSEAASDDGQYLSVGIGRLSCATWTNEQDDQVHTWVLGYWSGLNAAGTPHFVGEQTDGQGIAAEVRKLCAAEPSMRIDEATVHVRQQMIVKGR